MKTPSRRVTPIDTSPLRAVQHATPKTPKTPSAQFTSLNISIESSPITPKMLVFNTSPVAPNAPRIHMERKERFEAISASVCVKLTFNQ